MPLSDGGRVAWVYQHQQPFCDGHVEADALELAGIRHDLRIRSTLAVPFAAPIEGQGVLVVRSVAADHFAAPDLELLGFVAYWTRLVARQTAATDGHEMAVPS